MLYPLTAIIHSWFWLSTRLTPIRVPPLPSLFSRDTKPQSALGLGSLCRTQSHSRILACHCSARCRRAHCAAGSTWASKLFDLSRPWQTSCYSNFKAAGKPFSPQRLYQCRTGPKNSCSSRRMESLKLNAEIRMGQLESIALLAMILARIGRFARVVHISRCLTIEPRD